MGRTDAENPPAWPPVPVDTRFPGARTLVLGVLVLPAPKLLRQFDRFKRYSRFAGNFVTLQFRKRHVKGGWQQWIAYSPFDRRTKSLFRRRACTFSSLPPPSADIPQKTFEKTRRQWWWRFDGFDAKEANYIGPLAFPGGLEKVSAVARLRFRWNLLASNQFTKEVVCECVNRRASGVEKTFEGVTGLAETRTVIGDPIRDLSRTLIVSEKPSFSNVVRSQNDRRMVMPLEQVQLRVKRMARSAVFDHVHLDSPVEQFLEHFSTRASEIDPQDESHIRTGGSKFEDVFLDPYDGLKSNESGNKDNS